MVGSIRALASPIGAGTVDVFTRDPAAAQWTQGVRLTDRARVRLVHVCVDRKTFQKRPLPDGLRAGFKALGLISE